jgi:hypothetical protein
MVRKAATFILLGLFFSITTVFAEILNHPLIEKARQERMNRFQYALANGAQVALTADGKSYYILWLPEGRNFNNLPPMVVTLHGHDGYAFDDFYVWHHFLKERGYGVLAIQWWLGKGEATSDYLLPNEIYRIIDQTFRELQVKPGTALLHGFSRASTNIYAIAAIDRSTKNDYFALFIANAGRASSDYPPTHEIEQGRFGNQPFAGSHWVTFAGGKDPNPDRDGVVGMRETADWIESYGGSVDLAIEDPDAGHGGFHQNPKNANAALDIFEKLRSKDEK